MHTYFIGVEEVDGYSKDFLKRFHEKDFPLIWCPIGLSGKEFVNVILDNSKSAGKTAVNKVLIIPLIFNRESNRIELEDTDDSKYFTGNPYVLIVDSSVHSGTTMFEAVKFVESHNVTKITSYSLVVKRGSKFIPNYFGLIVSEYDRAYFLLKEIPNNRLNHTGIVRKLMQKDVDDDPNYHLNTGTAGMDELKVSDLWYDVKARKSQVYVYEQDKKIYGFISFHVIDNSHWLIDFVAIEKERQKQGIASNLIRFVETLARSSCCANISLWAKSEAIKFYEKLAFEKTGKDSLVSGSEKLEQMNRKLLYTFDS